MERLRDDDDGWARVAALLDSGEVVAIPTDTVYGVAAAVRHPAAVARLFPLKDRDSNKPVAVLVDGVEQAATVIVLDAVAGRLAAAEWPGALTLVLPRSPEFDVDLGGAGDTVGVRLPDQTRVRELCRRVGPLATTSANRSGHPTPADGAGVAAELDGTSIAAVLDAGSCAGAPSTVVRLDDGRVEVLREGPVDVENLISSLRDLT